MIQFNQMTELWILCHAQIVLSRQNHYHTLTVPSAWKRLYLLTTHSQNGQSDHDCLSGNAFCVDGGQAAVPQTRKIHEAHFYLCQIPPGRLLTPAPQADGMAAVTTMRRHKGCNASCCRAVCCAAPCATGWSSERRSITVMLALPGSI